MSTKFSTRTTSYKLIGYRLRSLTSDEKPERILHLAVGFLSLKAEHAISFLRLEAEHVGGVDEVHDGLELQRHRRVNDREQVRHLQPFPN